MGDLGTVGFDTLYSRLNRDIGPRWAIRSFLFGSSEAVLGARDNTEGNPAQPSLRMDSRGVFRMRWKVLPGTRTITVSVKQAVNLSPRPTIVVRANPDIGVNSDVTETAPGGASWVTIGPATVTPSSAGVLAVELRANYDGQYQQAPCYWDNPQTA